MNNILPTKKILKELNLELKALQEKLAIANKLEGKDAFIEVKIKNNQANYIKERQKNDLDKNFGKFYLEINIQAKDNTVYIPVSVASGKRAAGFMYQVEGDALGSLYSADIKARGEGISLVSLGTILFAKIPAGKLAIFEIRAVIKGKRGASYKIVFTRLNYKLSLTELRYQQYLKELVSQSVTLS